ncbi:MAG: signal recognition particle protein Srp54 [Helicobacteraceae bacterium]|jgi:signal recognition particle subunit SRP54|nr:signal recognition particle protein Srp54 [Helicobacteraceae bacterium]
MFNKISEALGAAIARVRHFDDEKSLKRVLDDLRKALLKNDIHHKVVKTLIDRVEIETKQAGIQKEKFAAELEKALFDVLAAAGNQGFVFADRPPTIVVMAGLQGSGKTTTSAKLASYLKSRGKKVLLCGADLQRHAASEQLRQLAEQIEVEFITAGDPVKAAKTALDRAKSALFDVLIVDTAGRLAIDDALMNELAAIKNVISPHEIFYVADSLTGQDAARTAAAFHEKVALTGVILTKFDGDATGGVAISLAAQIGVPLRFLGTGEKVADLEIFIPERIVSRLLGGGDIATLAEKVGFAAIDEKKAKEVQRKIKKGDFNFNDFMDQLDQMSKIGNMKSLISMIPGAGGLADKLGDLDLENSKELSHTRAAIRSMTPRERENPDLLNPSRKARIASGAGLKIEEVNRIVKQFRNGAKIAKQFSGKGGMAKLQTILAGGGRPPNFR